MIHLSDGTVFDPLRPSVGLSKLTPRVIARGLAAEPRWGGQQTAWPQLSVAEHSVLVAMCIESTGGNRKTAYAGLMHDAPEGLGMHDMAKSIKSDALMTGYKRACGTLMYALARRFWFVYPPPLEVAEADLRLLVAEAEDLMPGEGLELFGPQSPVHQAERWPAPGRLRRWEPGLAETYWLGLWRRLAPDELVERERKGGYTEKDWQRRVQIEGEKEQEISDGQD